MEITSQTTATIANRLVELCRQGQYEQARRELYSDDAVSIEPEKSQAPVKVTKGLAAQLAKGEQFEHSLEAYHSGIITDPIIAGNIISIGIYMDVTFKGGYRTKLEEVGVYEVRDGKIISEQFFF